MFGDHHERARAYARGLPVDNSYTLLITHNTKFKTTDNFKQNFQGYAVQQDCNNYLLSNQHYIIQSINKI